jgi:uncharacterized PurR-regulated membrane protein YhhQ (DUF165 family)
MMRALGRLFFPVMLLSTVGAASLIYGSEPVRWLGNGDVGGQPFDFGLVALPFTFLVVQLTNRRYGAAYAVLQILGALALSIAAALYASDDLILLRGSPLPTWRFMAGFGTGVLFAQLISIVVFDRLRGPLWWQAPLSASLAGGATLSFIAYPAVYFGTGADWFGPMLAYCSVTVGVAVALLLPYWLLRPLIAPISGFGGY